MKKSGDGMAARMSDAAVQAKTGKTWGEWFAILDAAGARKMDHRAIVAYLRKEHGVADWWTQMVTVGYEQARGLRRKYERPSGYEVSRSKTVGVPVSALYAAWVEKRSRGRWLKGAGFEVRKATLDKSLRITWVDGKTNVEALFYPKGEGKSQVTVQHSKLAGAKQADRMKAYWAENLDRLRAYLEK